MAAGPANAMLHAALWYAELGYPVFPCKPGLNFPITVHGLLEATTDTERITAWWAQHPRANIAIRTDGLVVIDIGGEGNAWLADDSARLADLDVAALSLTPRGGRNYFFRQPDGRSWRNTAGRLALRVDTRANGGYVVVPPSIVGKRGYSWAEEYELAVAPSRLPEPPGWLVELLDVLAASSSISGNGKPRNTVPEGQRNETLARLAEYAGDVEPRQAAFDSVCAADIGAMPQPQAATPAPSPPAEVAALDDEEILRLARKSRKSGAKFASLWAGRWNEFFNSRSEADSSVVFTLAFYTKDAGQIDRIFRRSALMREKWDESHGQQTYGAMTIGKALATVTGQYESRKCRGGSGRNGQKSTTRPLSGEPPPGSIDPATGRLILSTERTLPTAEAYVQQFHQHPDGIALRHYAGLLMPWQGNRYVELEDDALRNRLLAWLHAAVRMTYDAQAEKWVAEDFPANPHTMKAALESVKAHTHLPATTVSPSWLDGNPDRPNPCEIIPCRSSLLHLPTMQQIAPSPAFFAVNALDYDHDPDAPEPTQWHSFLGQLFEDDLQSWDLLQEWFGNCLTGDTSQHKMLLIVGPRRSGKGTIARVLARLVGASNVCGPTTSSLAGPFGLQPLIGKSLAIVSDARFSGRDVQTVIERLLCISGEDTLTIDRKHMTSVTMKLPTRFVFLTNELPRLTDASGALAGRFMMLRLTESFYGREDKALTARLLTELPGILNWAIAGWGQLRECGHFIQPTSVEDALRDMEDLSSPVGAFVRERCDVGSGLRIWIDDLYTAWKEWCEADGRVTVTTKQTFGRDLMAAAPGVVTRCGTNGVRFYQGIGLRGVLA